MCGTRNGGARWIHVGVPVSARWGFQRQEACWRSCPAGQEGLRVCAGKERMEPLGAGSMGSRGLRLGGLPRQLAFQEKEGADLWS